MIFYPQKSFFDNKNVNNLRFYGIINTNENKDFHQFTAKKAGKWPLSYQLNGARNGFFGKRRKLIAELIEIGGCRTVGA